MRGRTSIECGREADALENKERGQVLKERDETNLRVGVRMEGEVGQTTQERSRGGRGVMRRRREGRDGDDAARAEVHRVAWAQLDRLPGAWSALRAAV